MSEIKKVKLKNSLANHVLVHGLVENIVKYVKQNIPKYLELKLDHEFTRCICREIDRQIINNKNLSKEQKTKISKSDILMEAFKELFNLSDDEIEILNSQIIFLNDNKMIKTKSILKKVVSGSSKFLKKLL